MSRQRSARLPATAAMWLAVASGAGGSCWLLGCSAILAFDELDRGSPARPIANSEAGSDATSETHPTSEASPDSEAPIEAQGHDVATDESAPKDAADGAADAPTDEPQDDAKPQGDASPAAGWMNCSVAANANDPKCQSIDDAVPGSVGKGILLPSKMRAGGGFTEGSVLVVPVSDLYGSGVLTIDLKTGDRTLVSGAIQDANDTLQSRGTGEALGDCAYVRPYLGGHWVAYNAAGNALVTIAPATGDRSLLKKLQPQQPCEGWANLDPATDYGFAADASGAIYYGVTDQNSNQGVVKLASDQCTVVSFVTSGNPSLSRGSGPSFAYGFWGLTLFDGALWMTSIEKKVMRLELTTGNRQWVSKLAAPQIGTGPGTSAFEALAHHRDYVWTGAAHGSLQLMKVDPANGDRIAFSASHGPASSLWDPNNQNSLELVSHPDHDLLIVLTQAIMLFDPATGDSNYLSH